ncbi:methyl-accepting chemotaxis protein [Haliovirga abyssi]|uniref:Methyl-accepting chemotaxis protein n=1 Tax=Haliovirga abyssi TaxID=2996794 RepID=A0AAU9DG89_9FUSO|nr:methyl-accepting chemotaxis protein [Haliovirga abyssi]BDU49694.1 hypothetical protein HLVA_02630 [Haliovirga abyssi]
MKLRNKFIIPTVGTVILIFIVMIWVVRNRDYKIGMAELNSKVERVSSIIGFTNINNIWNFDEDGMKKNLNSFFKDKEIISIVLKDADGNVASKVERKGKGDLIKKDIKIVNGSDKVGTAEVVFTDYYVKSSISSQVNFLIITVIIIILILIIVIFIISKMITNPIDDMVKILNKVAGKDLREKVVIKTKDEIGVLGKNINNVVDILKESVSDISVRASNLTAISENLAAASEESFRSVENVGEILEDAKLKAKDSVSYLDNINEIMLEMDKYLEQNDKNSKQTSQDASNTVESVKEGVEIVTKVAISMEDVKVQVATSSDTVLKLAGLLEKIDDFSQVITKISEQTNLLALNAAIEAARAGEAGKGFAVVATEVKNLAEESNKAAEEIGNMVKNIRSEANRSVEMMKETQNRVTDGSEKLSLATKVLNEINSYGANMAKNISTIVESLETQNREQLKIKDELATAVKASNDNYSSMETASEGLKDQIGAVQVVSESATEVVNNSENLAGLVSEFKLSLEKSEQNEKGLKEKN